ncbi:hypothetical protein OROGR_000708 [Orobanche gracilis]
MLNTLLESLGFFSSALLILALAYSIDAQISAIAGFSSPSTILKTTNNGCDALMQSSTLFQNLVERTTSCTFPPATVLAKLELNHSSPPNNFLKASLKMTSAAIRVSRMPFVIVAYDKDPSPVKLNLGVGVYRTEEGKPLFLNVVRRAEQMLVNDRSILPFGLADFNKLSAKLILGADSPAIQENRVTTVQCLSGSGSLRVGAEFLARHYHQLRGSLWSDHLKGVIRRSFSCLPRGLFRRVKQVLSKGVMASISNHMADSFDARGLFRRVKQVLEQEWQVKVSHVYREANSMADYLASMGCDELCIYHHPPDFILQFMHADCNGVSTPRLITV